MKRKSASIGSVVAVLVLAGAGYLLRDYLPETGAQPAVATSDTSTVAPARESDDIEEAFAARTSGVMVDAAGEVTRLLPDDDEGSRHQKFILRLASGQTVLVSHNIDLAPRVPVDQGERIELRGQYEWNERGGVVHWTHHDPGGRHPGGWIRHAGRKYE